MEEQRSDKLTLIANVVSGYLRRNSVGVDQISCVIGNVTRALADAEKQLAGDGRAETSSDGGRVPEKREPAVPVRSSVKPDSIACLECGLRTKTLKRHLGAKHNLDPRTYREKWGLKSDYPMVAPVYAEARSKMARRIGLGRTSGTKGPRKTSRKKAA